MLALMFLHDPVARARFSDGELVSLGDQDRSRSNSEEIAAGRNELERWLTELGSDPP